MKKKNADEPARATDPGAQSAGPAGPVAKVPGRQEGQDEEEEGVELAGELAAAEAAALPAEDQQRAVPGGAQEAAAGCGRRGGRGRPDRRDPEPAHEPGARGVPRGDGQGPEAPLQPRPRRGLRAPLRHQVDRLLQQVRTGLPAVGQVRGRALQR